MPKFYKATRMNGTAFHDGKTKYVVGKTVKIAKKYRPKNPRCCHGGVLHASDAAAETLVMGSYPCKLFEVTGEPVCHEGHKHGFFELKVIKELPSWQVLGPNGRLVVALVERLKKLTPAELKTVDAAWWDDARDDARDAVQYAVRYAVRNAARYAARDAARYAARIAAWDDAQNAARYAACALVVKDKISKEHFDVLYGPIGKVISLKELVAEATLISCQRPTAT